MSVKQNFVLLNVPTQVWELDEEHSRRAYRTNLPKTFQLNVSDEEWTNLLKVRKIGREYNRLCNGDAAPVEIRGDGWVVQEERSEGIVTHKVRMMKLTSTEERKVWFSWIGKLKAINRESKRRATSTEGERKRRKTERKNEEEQETYEELETFEELEEQFSELIPNELCEEVLESVGINVVDLVDDQALLAVSAPIITEPDELRRHDGGLFSSGELQSKDFDDHSKIIDGLHADNRQLSIKNEMMAKTMRRLAKEKEMLEDVHRKKNELIESLVKQRLNEESISHSKQVHNDNVLQATIAEKNATVAYIEFKHSRSLQ